MMPRPRGRGTSHDLGTDHQVRAGLAGSPEPGELRAGLRNILVGRSTQETGWTTRRPGLEHCPRSHRPPRDARAPRSRRYQMAGKGRLSRTIHLRRSPHSDESVCEHVAETGSEEGRPRVSTHRADSRTLCCGAGIAQAPLYCLPPVFGLRPRTDSRTPDHWSGTSIGDHAFALPQKSRTDPLDSAISGTGHSGRRSSPTDGSVEHIRLRPPDG